MSAFPYTPTPEQFAILAAVRDLQPGQLLKIQARAGTGKTSTLELLARSDDRKMLYLAYNTDIKAAAKKRFPDTVTCKTTHGLAMSALGIREWIPDKGAPRNIRSWELERWLNARRWHPGLKTGASQADIAADLLATVRAFMQSADPTLTLSHARCGQKKTRREAFEARAKQDNPTDPVLAEKDVWASYGRYREWLVEKATALWNAIIDRADSTLPLEHDAYLKLYQLQRPALGWALILLDECQDTNPCVMDLFLNQSSAKIMVGDEAQAIYGFRGAKDALKTPGAERTLLRSFRFGQAIADAANQILAFKAAYWPGFHQLQGDPHRVSAIGTVTNPPYTVICRSNQGVFMAALKAATAGLKINSGAKDLEASISYVESAHALLIGERLQKMHPEIAEFGAWDVLEQESQSDVALQWLVNLVKEYRETMPVLCEQLRQAKTRMKKSADVLLVTAHKSKGLEFDQVILADDFSALDNALNKIIKNPESAEILLEELSEQELHLLYVAATRAQCRLQPNATLKMMDTLAETLAKIRRNHAIDAPPTSALTPVPTAIAEPAPAADPANARAVFAAFLPELQDAMKAAGRAERWTSLQWQQETLLVAELIEAHHYAKAFIDQIVPLYHAMAKRSHS